MDEATDYPGHNIQRENDVHSWRECSERCDKNIRCQFWTYRDKELACHLKSTNEKKIDRNHAVSGRRGCKGQCQLLEEYERDVRI